MAHSFRTEGARQTRSNPTGGDGPGPADAAAALVQVRPAIARLAEGVMGLGPAALTVARGPRKHQAPAGRPRTGPAAMTPPARGDGRAGPAAVDLVRGPTNRRTEATGLVLGNTGPAQMNVVSAAPAEAI